MSHSPVCTLSIRASAFIDSSIVSNEPIVPNIGPIITIHVIVLDSSNSAHAFRFRITAMTSSMMSDNTSRCRMIEISDTSRISSLPFNTRDKVWRPFDSLCPRGGTRLWGKFYISFQFVTTRRIRDTWAGVKTYFLNYNPHIPKIDAISGASSHWEFNMKLNVMRAPEMASIFGIWGL